MPITLGCPSCGKRFRARDESAGKRVKCLYCSSPVSVPTSEESAAAGAPTSAMPGESAQPSAGSPFGGSRGPSEVASPDEWGAGGSTGGGLPSPTPSAPAPAPFQSGTNPLPDNVPPPPPRPTRAPATRPAPRPAPQRQTSDDGETPEQIAAASWKKAKAGTFWVLFGLFFLALPGFVGFAKLVIPRFEVEMPTGPGAEWVSIPGFLNTNDPGAITLNQSELIDVAAYGAPFLLGGLCIALGRFLCAGAPRSSGARGLFGCSALFTTIVLAGVIGAAAFDPIMFRTDHWSLINGFLIALALAEFWFLTGLAASGSALKRPVAARAVGALGFIVALAVALGLIGWDYYSERFRPDLLSNPDLYLYEQGALMLGWLLIVGMYWRAVRTVRGGMRDFLDTVEG